MPLEREAEPDAEVSEHVEVTLGAKQAGDEHPRRCHDQHVQRNADIGSQRTDGGDEVLSTRRG